MPRKEQESKPITRSHTCDVQQLQRRHEPVVRRYEGNSQFIRNKFDMDYDPKYRVLKVGHAPYLDSVKSKLQGSERQLHQLDLLAEDTHKSIRQGKMIVIDWSRENNFRATRYATAATPTQKEKRSVTEQIPLSYVKELRGRRGSDCLSKLIAGSADKSIINKSEHLGQLISQSVADKRHRKNRLGRKPKYLSTEVSDYASTSMLDSSVPGDQASSENQNPYFNYSIIEEVKEKQKSFFERNGEKIMKAINFENYINNSKPVELFNEKRKVKLEEVQERIICKCKLTLLKSELAKKFKEIRDGLADCHRKPAQTNTNLA